MTAIVAVNRCLDIKMLRRDMPPSMRCFFNSGTAQALTVFFFMTISLLPHWFEFTIVNHSINDVTIKHTSLRDSEPFKHIYLGILSPICLLLIPLTMMVISTILMLRQLWADTASLSSTVIQKEQEKRNRSISIMLIGIIILFVICHLPTSILSLYQHAAHKGSEAHWVKYVNVMKHTLAVTNSSLNFAVYCKDNLFRWCAKKIYNKLLNCQQIPTDKSTGTSGTPNLSGVPRKDVESKDLDLDAKNTTQAASLTFS